MRIRVGLAGWSNPPAKRFERDPDQTHLSYYAAHFSCVEINSSFYRTHQSATYARWRDETPAPFRFSVKMPRSVTHESHLKRCAAAHFGPVIGGLFLAFPLGPEISPIGPFSLNERVF
jgi:uncharacterized protein YecE (DUF72 family)